MAQVKVSDALIEMVARGAYQKHGREAVKIRKEIESVLSAKFSVFIMDTSTSAYWHYGGVSVAITDNLRMAVWPCDGVATVKETDIKWLETEYGWAEIGSSATQLISLRNNIKQKLRDKAKLFHQVVVISANLKTNDGSFYGKLWRSGLVDIYLFSS